MNKLIRYASIFMISIISIFNITPIYADEVSDNFTIINRTENITVYQDENVRARYAILEELPERGSIIVFDDGKDKVILDIDNKDSISTRAGNSGWSAGSLPSGNSVLTPHHSAEIGGISASFQASVTCYPPTINYTFNQSVTASWGGTAISGVSANVINRTANANAHAVAQLSFYANGNYNYLSLEISASGKVKISWSY